MKAKKNSKEAVLVGFKLVLVDGLLMTEIIDTPNKRVADIFKPEDWLFVNAAMNTVRRTIKSIHADIKTEMDAVNRYL
jgi:hypothetical protein